jgi:6-phosphogluconate dehydrogenase
MRIGMVGLGKMGANMAQRLIQGGHQVVGFNRTPEAIERLQQQGGEGVGSLEALVQALEMPRLVWLMVPAGKPTGSTVEALSGLLSPGDVVVDGGNSNYKETMQRGEHLAQAGIQMVDVGTSGGIWGLTEGYSLMVGGDKRAVELLRPILEVLAPAPDRGWGHVGPRGAGHFTKMIHNGIEYGMMQAYAEGFEILRSKQEFELDLHQVAEIWRSGSVVRSWLLDLIARALDENPDLEGIKAWVADSGEGRWTAFEAIDLDVPAPVITLALQARFFSRQDDSYAARLLAAMRNQFGGHAVKSDFENS